MGGEEAKVLYDEMLGMLKKEYKEDKIFGGKFGAYMSVDIENDGPVTMELEFLNDKESK